MTSPITHEKIIEVLRDVTTAGNHAASQLVKRLGPDFVEDYFPATTSPETALNQMGDIVSYDFWVIWSAAMKARDLYQRLQAEKEGGPVAPPASANAGTGRATADEIVDRFANWLFDTTGTVTGKYTGWKGMRRAIADALSSEHQRGLAEGERIGIEKAAKWHEDCARNTPRGIRVFSHEKDMADAANIRALTGDPQT